MKEQHYKIIIHASLQELNPLNDNVDVEVIFDNGVSYVATFFTLENIRKRMEYYEQSGECMYGFYFWAANMIIVRKLTLEDIARVVSDLLSEGEFERAFSKVPSLANE